MNLEQRVDLVERELDLLKAQIQTILLEIHEYILSGSYTRLRGLDSAPSGPTPAAMEALSRLRTQETAAVTPSDDILPKEWLPEAEQAEVAAKPPIKKFTLPAVEAESAFDPDDFTDEMPAAPTDAFASLAPTMDEGQEFVNPFQPTDMHAWIELDQWVSQKIKELGVDATRDLVNLYGGQERDLLMKFIQVYMERTGQASASKPSAATAPPAQKQAPEEARRPSVLDAAQNRRNGNTPPAKEEPPAYRRSGEDARRQPAETWQNHNNHSNGNGNGYAAQQRVEPAAYNRPMDDYQRPPNVERWHDYDNQNNGNGNGYAAQQRVEPAAYNRPVEEPWRPPNAETWQNHNNHSNGNGNGNGHIVPPVEPAAYNRPVEEPWRPPNAETWQNQSNGYVPTAPEPPAYNRPTDDYRRPANSETWQNHNHHSNGNGNGNGNGYVPQRPAEPAAYNRPMDDYRRPANTEIWQNQRNGYEPAAPEPPAYNRSPRMEDPARPPIADARRSYSNGSDAASTSVPPPSRPAQEISRAAAADVSQNSTDARSTSAAPVPARPAAESPRQSLAEQWQKHANAKQVKNATYRPFGEHQELVLRLIADVLNYDGDDASTSNKGQTKR